MHLATDEVMKQTTLSPLPEPVEAQAETNLYAQSLDTIRARYPYLDTLELATLMAMRARTEARLAR